MSQVANRSETIGGLQTADFDYDLPVELIAQNPLERRDSSRLLVLDRGSAVVHHSTFSSLGSWLAPGDLFVANNSRVIPARLRGHRAGTRGAVEILLLRRSDAGLWSALAKPAKRLKGGDKFEVTARVPGIASAIATVEANLGHGELVLHFDDGADERLDAYGEVPIPPYITQTPADAERYQTVYATVAGSAAAPTAGLHFTAEIIDGLLQQGFAWAEVTLHVGLDTFRPVTVDYIRDHPIHEEWCEVPTATAEAVAACRRRGGRIIAVGTTAARTLETLGATWRDEAPVGFSGFTDTFIVPGHRWRLVDALLTNFHLPRSTLMMLVSALAGREAVLEAYAEATRHRYRFYSFGDAMLIR